MKEYTKPIIEEEEFEIEDVIAASGLRSLDVTDDKDPFDNLI